MNVVVWVIQYRMKEEEKAHIEIIQDDDNVQKRKKQLEEQRAWDYISIELHSIQVQNKVPNIP